MTRHYYITQNNKVAISLQYIQKEVSDEIDLSHVDKHESSLQINTMIFDGHGQTFPKFAMSLQYLQKQVRDEVIFLHADKHPSFLQVYFNTLGVKVFYKLILSLLMGIIKQSQSAQINKFAIYLQ